MASPRTPGQETLAGTIRVFVAEALIFPTGLITSAFLTRELGAEGYGLLSLAAMLVAWVEWSLVSLFTRATIRLVRHAEEWKPLGARILHLALALGLAAGAGLWALAPPLAGWLDAPALVGHLRLFAADVPLFALAYAHRSVLTGRGAFGLRAWAVATRWLARLGLVLILVGLGLSVTGAILAMIGASIAELFVATRYDRPSLFSWPRVPTHTFFEYALPLLLAASAKRFCQEIDLFALKALGGTTAEAGLYAAARNLAIVPSIFATAFSPLLLATLTGLVREGAVDHARMMSRDGLRLILLLAPFAGIAAGAAEEIVRLAFGDAFAPAAPLMARLVFAGLAGVFMTVATTSLIAGGRPTWPLYISAPLVPLVVAGHLFAIPRWGAAGAASVTVGVNLAEATVALLAVRRAWGIDPLLASAIRSGAVSLAAWAAAAAWPTPGWLVVLKLVLLAAAVPPAFLALGELGRREIALVRSLLPGAGDRATAR